MRISLIALAGALTTAPAIARPDAPSPILTARQAHDALSYAKPQVARVTHVDLDLKVDFATRTVAGTAALDILARPGAKEIVLDDNKLVIAKITDAAGHTLKYRVGTYDDYKGAPLTVEIGRARRIVVTYRSSPDASALGWLDPSLTAGKKKPYLYSQGESINNRSWIPTQDSPDIRQSLTAKITRSTGPMSAGASLAAMLGRKILPRSL